jgi:hypothetical protein
MLNPNFVCVCNHLNKMHISTEEALKYNTNGYRICIEYKDSICVNGIRYHNSENICHCGDFIPDNLRFLEQQCEKVV